jgi:hypothetical protein
MDFNLTAKYDDRFNSNTVGLDPIHLIPMGFSPIGNVSDQDPYVFGPPGSESFHQQTKN